jgi:GMP synthase PP-ATPase subunit
MEENKDIKSFEDSNIKIVVADATHEKYVDATDRFLGLLEGVAEPEQKRKIIGGEFIRVFEEEACKLAY